MYSRTFKMLPHTHNSEGAASTSSAGSMGTIQGSQILKNPHGGGGGGGGAAAPPPPEVPEPPFTLTSNLIELRTHSSIKEALIDAKIDFGPLDDGDSDKNWSWQCFVFRSSGHTEFNIHIYSRNGNYLLELRRMSGCLTTFRHSYYRLISAFGARGLLIEGSVAAAHFAKMSARRSAPPASSAPSPLLPPPPFDEYADPDNSEDLVAVALTLALPEADKVLADIKLSSIIENLASDYDDVSTPTAQDLARLACNQHVRAALGAVFKDYFDKHATTPTPPLAIKLLSLLLSRVIDKPAGSTSIKCRTACALALGSMARETKVADALLMFKAPALLLDSTKALLDIAHARNACLRRQLVRTVWHVISPSPKHAELSGIGEHVLVTAPVAICDSEFDVTVSSIVARLRGP